MACEFTGVMVTMAVFAGILKSSMVVICERESMW